MDISSAAIDQFITELIAQKFPDQDMDEAMVADIRRELTDRLNQYLTLRTIEMISNADPEAVSKLSELIKTNPSPQEVGEFIKGHIKEPDVLVAQIFTDFRNLYLGIVPPVTN